MRILGLSSFTHDIAAAVLEDGTIRAVMEESKLVRAKNTRGLPEAAIRFCLKKTGATWRDLDFIAVSGRPVRGWIRRSMAGAKVSPLSPVAAAYCQVGEIGRLARELGYFRVIRHQDRAPSARIVDFEHQLCHAASAFFLSPFERALIITMDEEGDGKSGLIGIGEGTKIRVLRTIPYPHSLAWLYSQITELLGFVPHLDEHKTQWLSLEGKPLYRDALYNMLRKAGDGSWRLDGSYLDHGIGGRFVLSSKFYSRVGLPRQAAELSEDHRRALAATVQEVCTEVISEMVQAIRKREGLDQFCFAGGLFQNSLLVHSLEQNLGLDQVFVPPAPGNAGCALGAALLAQHQVLGMPRAKTGSGVYWGTSYSRQEIKDVLENCKARFSLHNTKERRSEVAVKLLQSGKIIAWFQGANEFGPRALGNRSVLASPWAPYVKENLNDFIKHREWFRPFAISMPEEDAARYFEYSQLCRFMNTLARVRPGTHCLPNDFVLPGNLVRLHTVEKQTNPALWDLLKRFGETAPAPMLLNTSFNLFGEPLVVSPLDAIRSYSCSGVDALMLDNFLLSKAPVRTVALAAENAAGRIPA